MNELLSAQGDLEARTAYENKYHNHRKRKAQNLAKDLEILRGTSRREGKRAPSAAARLGRRHIPTR